MRNGQDQPQLPPWAACTIHKVCRVELPREVGGVREGYVQSIGGGFLELVLRDAIASITSSATPTYKFTPIFLHVAHICSIAPVEAQWTPPRLAVVEKPKLVVP